MRNSLVMISTTIFTKSPKNVTRVNFDKIYSYAHQQMVINQFDKIFQGIIDVDPSCTFPLSRYFPTELYKNYVPYVLTHRNKLSQL